MKKVSKKFGMPTKTFSLPIFNIGNTVFYKNSEYTIEMVYISGHKILLKLSNIADLIDSSMVMIEYTKFEL